MADFQEDIIKRLQTLSMVPGVKVTVSDYKGTVNVKCNTVFSLDFRFKWQSDHYIGYPVDADGERNHAVVSLWSASEAAHFVMAYTLLAELRADRRA